MVGSVHHLKPDGQVDPPGDGLIYPWINKLVHGWMDYLVRFFASLAIFRKRS